MGGQPLLLGEFTRTLDERFRISIPSELAAALCDENEPLFLAKERAGCVSLWRAARWQQQLQQSRDVVESKVAAGRLDGQLDDLQLLGRLLSTRHRETTLTGRGRLLIPDGFREFLGVEPGGEVFVVGAAVCIELWRPDAWIAHVEQEIPQFRQVFDRLSS